LPGRIEARSKQEHPGPNLGLAKTTEPRLGSHYSQAKKANENAKIQPNPT
jgi:hypothetical protein